MRGVWSTLGLLVVLGGLVGYIYFVDRNRTPDAPEAKAKAFAVSPENIEEVQIKNASGETAHVQRVDTSWRVIEPEKADADATEVASLTSSLAGLEVQRVVDENPADVAQYGLNPPKIEIAFRAKDQKEFSRLLVGEKTPTGGDVYAKTPDQKRVFLISSYLESTFNKNAFNLRDKAILKFDRDKAETIDVVNGPGTMQFARQGTEWKIVKPFAARADFAAIEGLVQRLSSAQMQKIVEPEAKDLGKYGLDRPPLRVDVGSGSAKASLLVGMPSPEDTPYAKDAARPSVFTIEKALTTDLSKAVGDYRRKDVFDMRSFNANRVELRRDSGTQIFEKTKGSDGKEVWKDGAGKNVDMAKIEDLLTKLTNLRAQSFEVAAPPAMKMPALTAIVRFDDGNKMETVTFAKMGTDAFAARADEPGAAKLEATSFDDALKSLDALK
jgi:uncharacterized protein DUF4340